MAAPRDAHTRKADTLAKLHARNADIWVASASADGTLPVAHLVPLSLAWIDERVVVAAPAGQRTARNIAEHGKARLALGPTRDVVIIDAVLERLIGVADVPEDFADRYAAQGQSSTTWCFGRSGSRPGARKTSSLAAPSYAVETG